MCRNSHHRSVMGASFDQTSGSFVDRGIVCRLTGTSFPGLLDKNRRRAEGLWLIRVAWEGYESGKKAITPNRVIYKCILRVEYWKFDLILFSSFPCVCVCVYFIVGPFFLIVDVRRRPYGRRKAKREREREIGKGYRSSTKGRMIERWSADAVVATVTIVGLL